MILLALETATSVCSVALLQDGHLSVELTLDRPRAHAENLVLMIGDALRYSGLKPSDVDAVAVSAGPGSYTGLRIGVSTAKGLAAAVDAELVAVPSLEALAAGITCAQPGEYVAAAFDARRDEAYVAQFCITEQGDLRAEEETAVVRASEIASFLHAERPWLVGEGWSKMVDDLDAAGIRYRRLLSLRPSAANVARLGLEKFESRHTEDLVTFEPYYLKDFVATTPRSTPFEKLSF